MSVNWLYQPPHPKDLNSVKNYVVFDTETTGLNPDQAEIIEVSALKVEDGQVVDSFSSLIKPHNSISPFITKLTGIDDELVAGADEEKLVMERFLPFIKDCLLIGHNVSFDINFVSAASYRLGQGRLPNHFIDTLQISRLLLPKLGHHKLGDLVDHFHLTNEAAHRAWGDCQATYQLFMALAAYQKSARLLLKKHKAEPMP